MAAKLGGDSDEGIVDINITPFVDIVLVVLIIFMVTATYIANKSIKVELPEAATGESVEQTSLAISLQADGTITLDGEPTDLAALRAHLRSERMRTTADNTELICLIAADRSVPHGSVVEIMDLVRQEGIARFAINIEPKAVPPEAAGGAGPVSARPAGTPPP